MSSFRQLMMRKKGGGISARYTQVDWIRTTVNERQYINTGIKADTDVRTVAKVISDYYWLNMSVFGGATQVGGFGDYYVTPFNNKWYYGINGGELNAGSYSNNTLYEIDYNDNGTLKINGNTIASGFTVAGNGTVDILISCRFLNNYGQYKYYYFKMYKGANLVFDGVPVYDTVDNVYGMWDVVSQAFFGNSSSGTITGGND